MPTDAGAPPTKPTKKGEKQQAGGGSVYAAAPDYIQLANQLGLDPSLVYSYWRRFYGKGMTAGQQAAATTQALSADGRIQVGSAGSSGTAPGASAPATSGGSSGGSSGGGSAGPSAKDLARMQANAEAGFMSYLRSWGMVVTPKLKKLAETAAKGDWNSQAFLIAVRGTEEYKKTFPGIQWRRGMTEASYNAQYDRYADRSQDAGYRLTREGFSHILKKGIDEQEWALRVSAVKQVKANPDLLENIRQFQVQIGMLKPNEKMSAQDVFKLATGRASGQFTRMWNMALVETGLEEVGFTVGRNSDLTRGELRGLLKEPMSKLGPGESLEMDYAALAQTAAEVLPASRLYKSGITKKDLVVMALGGKNAAGIAARVKNAVDTARATAAEQAAVPQLNQGGMQAGGMYRTQATE